MNSLEFFHDDLWMDVYDEVQNFLTEKGLLLTDDESDELGNRIEKAVQDVLEDYEGVLVDL